MGSSREEHRVLHAPSAHTDREMRAPSGARSYTGDWQAVDPHRASVALFERRRKERAAKTRWRVVFWIAIAVLVVAVAALGVIWFNYERGDARYDDVAESAFSGGAGSIGDATSLSDITVDWDALRAINPDTVGWVLVPGTTVNYPIVYSGDDSLYLVRDFYGETNPLVSFGAIFLSGENAPDFSDDLSVVYGHHLLNGSMFSPFAGFTDEAEFNAHRTVYVLTPEGNIRLTTFSLVHAASTDPIVQPNFASDALRLSYIQDKVDRSIVAPDDPLPALADITQLFAFSTCDNLVTNGRYVLFCYVAESTHPNVSAVGGTASGEGA